MDEKIMLVKKEEATPIGAHKPSDDCLETDSILSYEDQLHAIEIERLKQEVKQLKQDTHQRKLLVGWVVFMVSAWIVGVLVIVFCYAFPKTNGLSDTVLCTLIRATAIIGLAFIVLRGLFAVKKGR